QETCRDGGRWHPAAVQGRKPPVNAIRIALLAGLLGAVALIATACGRDIGDDCQTSVDCDPNGNRACDLSQPGGYCTVQGCNETSCPSSASCIRFFPAQYLSQMCNVACNPTCTPCAPGDPSCPCPDC